MPAGGEDIYGGVGAAPIAVYEMAGHLPPGPSASATVPVYEMAGGHDRDGPTAPAAVYELAGQSAEAPQPTPRYDINQVRAARQRAADAMNTYSLAGHAHVVEDELPPGPADVPPEAPTPDYLRTAELVTGSRFRFADGEDPLDALPSPPADSDELLPPPPANWGDGDSLSDFSDLTDEEWTEGVTSGKSMKRGKTVKQWAASGTRAAGHSAVPRKAVVQLNLSDANAGGPCHFAARAGRFWVRESTFMLGAHALIQSGICALCLIIARARR